MRNILFLPSIYARPQLKLLKNHLDNNHVCFKSGLPTQSCTEAPHRAQPLHCCSMKHRPEDPCITLYVLKGWIDSICADNCSLCILFSQECFSLRTHFLMQHHMARCGPDVILRGVSKSWERPRRMETPESSDLTCYPFHFQNRGAWGSRLILLFPASQWGRGWGDVPEDIPLYQQYLMQDETKLQSTDLSIACPYDPR